MDNQNENAVYNARELGMAKTFVFGLQHMFAMFGATVLVPAITGLSVSATLLFAGAGTLLFHALTKMKVPAFLGSSFAFLAAYLTIAPNGEKELLPYACFGVALAGLIYLVLAVFFKAYGAKKVMRFFPPVVTGPIIISIGLVLSGWALSCCQVNWGLALIAVAVIIICNIFGKGMVKIIPILIGIVVSYTVAALTGNVDFSNVAAASWIGIPFQMSDTVFSLIGNADKSLLLTAAVTAIPISLATMMEHIGDVAAIGSTVERNFIADPGLHRTLTGDGLATAVASLFGAPANTTYSENTGVLALTKVYDPFVIRVAAFLAILMSFCPKFAALISAMPTATLGGVSLILYGMISAIGVRNVVESKVDFSKSRNVIIAGLIMVLAVGIKYGLPGESIVVQLGTFTIGMSGLATAALVGILMNAILPGNEYEFDDGLNDSATLGRY
jgi:uracil permease